MADTKVSALTPTAPALTDLTYGVDDPGGTPASVSFTLQAIMDLFEANFQAPADFIDAITEISASLKTGADATLATGTAGTDGQVAKWNTDGDLVGETVVAVTDLVEESTPTTGDFFPMYDGSSSTIKKVATANMPGGSTDAASVSIADAGGYLTATNVEAALQELAAAIVALTPDTDAPTLLSTSPADDSTAAAVDTVIDLVFNEAVVLGTGNIVLRDNDGGFADLEVFNAATGTGAGGGTLSIVTTNITDDTVRITPGSNLTNSMEYAIRVASTAVEDTSSNAYAGIADDTTFSFSAVAAAPAAIYEDDFTTDTSATYSVADGTGSKAYNGTDDTLEYTTGTSAWNGVCTAAITTEIGVDYTVTIEAQALRDPGDAAPSGGLDGDFKVGTAVNGDQLIGASTDRFSSSNGSVQTLTQTFTATSTSSFITVRQRGGGGAGGGAKFAVHSILVEEA